MKYFLLALALLGVFVSCGGSKEKFPPPPAWVQSRPLNSTYYIGVGKASKAIDDGQFEELAKSNALSDMISEIKVNVSSESFLTTIDRSAEFEQVYEEVIKTSVTDQVKNYETVGTYQDAEYYYVYIRISKAQYLAEKAAEKQKVVDEAMEYFQKAKSYESLEEYFQAMNFYLKTFLHLKDYAKEKNEVDFEGEKIVLDRAAYFKFSELASQIKIVVDKNSSQLTFEQKYRDTIHVMVLCYGAPIKNAIVDVRGLSNVSSLYTNDEGMTSINISKESRSIKNKIELDLELAKMLGNLESNALSKKLIGQITVPKTEVALNFVKPLIYLNFQEQNLDQELKPGLLKGLFSAQLSSKGFVHTETPADADVMIELTSNTNTGDQRGNFYTSFLNIGITVRNLHNDEKLYGNAYQNLKGVFNSYESAGIKAYEGVENKLKFQDIKKIVDVIY